MTGMPRWEVWHTDAGQPVLRRAGDAEDGDLYTATDARSAKLLALLAAADEWADARRDEDLAQARSFAANQRGPAWFARCVAGERRIAAEHALADAYDALVGEGGRR